MGIRYGKVRCPKCDTRYGLDESHVCAAASIQLVELAADAAALPDPETLPDPEVDAFDRSYPAGLTWVEPLMSRPIPIGPSADHPELRPALALDAGRFWSGARHGLAVGRALVDVEEGAVWYAIAPNMRSAPERLAFLADATETWLAAIHDYARAEMSA